MFQPKLNTKSGTGLRSFKLCDPVMRLIFGTFTLAAFFILFVSFKETKIQYRTKIELPLSQLPQENLILPVAISPSTAAPAPVQSESQNQINQINGFQPCVDPRDIQLMVEETEESLVREVREKWLKAPSTLPYNYTDVPHNSTAVDALHKRVVEIFNYKKNGIFIESGGYDGVFLSNTLHLERDFEWTGLLVEADPKYYKILESAHRKAWIINACFGLDSTPKKVRMTRIKDEGALSKLNEVAQDWFKDDPRSEEFETQCFPFATILAAAAMAGNDQLVVDYWSLDIEGAEIKVLKTIPWDFVYIKVISIEVSGRTSVVITNFLEMRNYARIEHFNGPYIHDNLYIHKRFMREMDERIV